MLRSAPIAAHRLALMAAVLLAAGALGCSDRACFRADKGTTQCPSALNAKPRFGDCSNIETIDSDGSLVAGNLCCYDVTHSLDGIPGPDCKGIGGFSSRSSGDVPPGDHVATATDVGVGPETTASSGPGTGGTSSSGGGFGGAPNCDTLACGFKPDEPISGCLSCAESMLCMSQSAACDSDMECTEFESCLGGCDITDQACIAGCRAMFPSGASLFATFLQCAACDACATSCASSPVMGLAMCSGAGGAAGAGGSGGAGGTHSP